MKKLLQASTAIIGVAMIASSAHAGLEISGTGRLMISMGGDLPGADSMQFDTEGYYIGFSGSKKTDSGLTLSGGAFLNDSKNFITESDNVNASWDKTNFAISGGFGKVEVTNKGDASNLSGTATYLEAAEYGFDALTPAINGVGGTGTAFYKTSIEVPRGTTRINYYSPNINGFSAGFSMMESGGDAEYNGAKEGGSITGSFTSSTIARPVAATADNIVATKGAGSGVVVTSNVAAYEVALAAVNIGSVGTEATRALTVNVGDVAQQAIIQAIRDQVADGDARSIYEGLDATATEEAQIASGRNAEYATVVAGVEPQGSTIAANGHKSAIAIGVKYVSTFGLTFGYGTTTYSQTKTLKGLTGDVTGVTDIVAKATVEAGLAAAANGEYSNGWTGTRLNLGYSTGPFSAGFTTTTKENDRAKVAGVQADALKDGDKANTDWNNTVIALKYNYGAGSVSYVSKTEDAAKQDANGLSETQTEDLAASIISVSHTITPGVNAYLQSVSVDGEFDGSNNKYETASELILGLTVSF